MLLQISFDVLFIIEKIKKKTTYKERNNTLLFIHKKKLRSYLQ